MAPAGPPIGAEIRGIDLSMHVPGDIVELLRGAWANYLVLLLRDQKLDQKNYLDTIKMFGEPVTNGAKNFYAKLGAKSLWHAMDYDEL